MRKKENIVRFTADEIVKKLTNGGDKTDWKRVDVMSPAEIEKLADEEDGVLPEGWENNVIMGLPPLKKDIHIRLDSDILDWFKSRGAGYQTRMNAVLRAFVQAHQQTRKPQN